MSAVESFTAQVAVLSHCPARAIYTMMPNSAMTLFSAVLRDQNLRGTTSFRIPFPPHPMQMLRQRDAATIQKFLMQRRRFSRLRHEDSKASAAKNLCYTDAHSCPEAGASVAGELPLYRAYGMPPHYREPYRLYRLEYMSELHCFISATRCSQNLSKQCNSGGHSPRFSGTSVQSGLLEADPACVQFFFRTRPGASPC